MRGRLQADRSPNGAAPTDLEQALVLWLRWNDAHEQIQETLFARRHDPAITESLLDELDQLRDRAAALSRQLLR
jgi:hypothetical protein